MNIFSKRGRFTVDTLFILIIPHDKVNGKSISNIISIKNYLIDELVKLE